MNEQPLSKTGDGTESGDWTYVDDNASGLLQWEFSEEANGEAFNFGSVKGGGDSISR